MAFNNKIFYESFKMVFTPKNFKRGIDVARLWIRLLKKMAFKCKNYKIHIWLLNCSSVQVEEIKMQLSSFKVKV